MIWFRVIFIIICFIGLICCGHILDKRNPKVDMISVSMVGAIMMLSILIGLFLGIILCGLG